MLTIIGRVRELGVIEIVTHLVRLVLQLPVVRAEGRVGGPGVVKVRLGLIHVVLLVLVMVVILGRTVEMLGRSSMGPSLLRRVEATRSFRLEEERVASAAIELSVLRILIVMLVAVMVISIARLVIEDVALLLKVGLGQVQERRARQAVTLMDQVGKSTRMVRLLRHRMMC